MRKVKLGGKVEVSQCCLGTMTWGVQNTEEEAHAFLDYFLARGGNFVDTAEMYPTPPGGDVVGRTEQYIGTWLKQHPERREELFLASKACGPRSVGWCRANRKRAYAEMAADDTFSTALNAEQIPEACEASLRRLQTEYLDLYQLHWPERVTPLFGRSLFVPPTGEHQMCPGKREFATVEEQVRAIGALISEGKVRHWGLSNETSYGVLIFCQTADRLGIPRPITLQNDFSLVDRRFETELAEACHYMGVSLIGYGPLAGGCLSGKYLPGFFEGASATKVSAGARSRLPAESRHWRFPTYQSRYVGKATAAAAAEYAEIAASKGLSPTTMALAWCASRPFMSSTGAVIIGATTLPQLEENMDALRGVSLDGETLAAIDRVHRRNPNPNCDQHLSAC